jgi:DNA-binding XRE family transcriptional regulator
MVSTAQIGIAQIGPAPISTAPLCTAQIRAARGLLKWTQTTLAHRAAVSTVTLNMIENETVRPRDRTLAAIRRALEAGGVQFIAENGTGVGVRFAPQAASRICADT